MVLSYRTAGMFRSFETVLLVSRLKGFLGKKGRERERETADDQRYKEGQQ
jgi:hypothetical protein